MKIAFIAEHYPPTEGGVATSAQRVARELVKLGLDVYLICFDAARPLDSEDSVIVENDQGVKISRVSPFFLKHKTVNVNNISENLKATFRRRAFNQMVTILQDKNIECVLSFYLLNAGYLALFIARQFNVPLIAGVRGNDIGRNIFNVERFGVIQWVINGAEKIVCVNEHLQRRLLLAFPEVKIKSLVIPNGINSIHKIDFRDKSKANILKTTTWGHEDLLLVFVGTLREKKGVVPLLNALELCDNERVKLLIVGPNLGSVELKMCGPLWQKLQEKGVLYVTGLVPRENVADWIIGCDVVVVPSLDDGMANGLLEGMLLGLCPIGTDVFNDVINNNENGVTVPCNDSKALAESFNYLDKNREKLLQMGINAKLTIERNHAARDEAKKYLNLFTTILNNAEREKNSTL